MKKVIDTLDSVTDWTGTGTVEKNDHLELVAGYNTSSLVFTLGDLIMSKVLASPIDVTGYTDLIFHVWSRRGHATGVNDKASTVQFMVKLNGVEEFIFNAPPDFSPVSISLSGITEIESIEFSQVSGVPALLVASNMIAAIDEIPVDIFEATAEGIQHELDYLGITFPLGTVSAAAGEETVLLPGTKWIEKYCAIRIRDNDNSEIHQLIEGNGEEWRIGGRMDGPAILHDYTDAIVELWIPIEWGMSDKEIILPGVAIWGFTPEPVARSSKLAMLGDSIRPTGARQERGEAPVQKYMIQLDVEARESQMDVLAGVYKAIRAFISKERLWINGYRHYITVEGAPQWVEPNKEEDQIFKATYTFAVEVKEDIWQRQPVVSTVSQDVDVAVKSD